MIYMMVFFTDRGIEVSRVLCDNDDEAKEHFENYVTLRDDIKIIEGIYKSCNISIGGMLSGE